MFNYLEWQFVIFHITVYIGFNKSDPRNELHQNELSLFAFFQVNYNIVTKLKKLTKVSPTGMWYRVCLDYVEAIMTVPSNAPVISYFTFSKEIIGKPVSTAFWTWNKQFVFCLQHFTNLYTSSKPLFTPSQLDIGIVCMHNYVQMLICIHLL